MLSRDFFKISESLVNCFILDMFKKTNNPALCKHINLKSNYEIQKFLLKATIMNHHTEVESAVKWNMH